MPRRPSTAPARSAWLLVYPDTYEIGLPNQGLQILYEILNERADAVAERSYAPWTDLEERAAARRAAAVLGRHPPRRPTSSTSWPSTSRPSSSTRTSSTASTWPACPCAPPTGAADAPARRRRRATATYNPEPLADFVDFFVLGDGEEVVGEITEVVGAWKRGGRTEPRASVLRALAGVTGVYVPSLYEVALRRPTAARGHRARSTPTCPAVVEKRTIADLADWPYPKQPARARSPRWCTTGSTSRCSGAAPGAAGSARPG